MAASFKFDVDENGVAVLTIQSPGDEVNKLSRVMLAEVDAFLTRMETDPQIKALIFISGKEDHFIVGADIHELLMIRSPEEARQLSRRAQDALNRLERLRQPLVAAIHGACLGGGLELALTCRYRIITDDPKTILGLPEVKLGLIPGAGGTQRLTRLVGAEKALDLILTGRHLRPKRAQALGIADELVHKSILLSAAKEAALALTRGVPLPRARGLRLRQQWMEKVSLGRKALFNKARARVLEKTHGCYPAPLKAIEAIRAAVELEFDKGLETEAQLFSELATTDITRQLIHLFLAINANKKDPVIRNRTIRPKPVEKLGIVGAGLMGSGLAIAAAKAGVTVRLKDQDEAGVARGMKACYDYFGERVQRGRQSLLEMQSTMDRISGGGDYAGFGRASLVIEAVFEDLAVKQKVVEELEAVVRDDCVVASNTSAIPITEIAKVSRRPERVLGMHFFSPAPKMPLVEIVLTRHTRDQALATAMEFGRRLGKTVIVVMDSPGFYTSRILAPYMNEAAHLLYEGAAVDAIDDAMLTFGFPVGPFTLLDEVGIDVAAKVAKILYDAYGERMAPPPMMQKIVEDGRLGRKNRRGFYTYNGTKVIDKSIYRLLPSGANRKAFSAEEIQQRLVMAMVNEAALCLQEGTLRNPEDGDLGAVLGLGFPPFRGGPFRYIDGLRSRHAVALLEKLHGLFGARFTIAPLLLKMAETDGAFYN